MSRQLIRREHIVQTGEGIDRDTAAQIGTMLQRRYPVQSYLDFTFKLMPLSVGAWLLVMAGRGHNDSEVLGCGQHAIDVNTVIQSADLLVSRWRAAGDG